MVDKEKEYIEFTKICGNCGRRFKTKKTIFILFMFVVLTSVNVFAIPAGGIEELYTFEKCEKLRVDVTADLGIDQGEYSLVDCTETSSNSWLCDCNDNYILRLNTTIKTINTYYFSMTYNWSEESQTKKTSSGGGGGPYTPTISDGETEKLFVYKSSKKYFYLNGERHSVSFVKEKNDKYIFEIISPSVIVELGVGENKTVIVGNESINVKLVKSTDSYFILEITNTKTPYSPNTTTPSTTTTTIKQNEEPEDEQLPEENITKTPTTVPSTTTTIKEIILDNKNKIDIYKLVIGGSLLALILITLVLYLRKKRGEEDYGSRDENEFKI